MGAGVIARLGLTLNEAKTASGKRARRALTFWGTRSGRTGIGRMAIGIWGPVRQRRRWLESRSKWEAYWCLECGERGRKCGIG